MPVTVEVPVRVVVDPQALRHRLADVEAAVAEATARALTNAVAVIGDLRGGFVAHEPRAAEVHWTGPGLPDVGPGEADRTVEAVRAAVAAAVAATLPRPGSAPDLATRLTTAPGEILDPDRLHRAAGLYTVPGYQDGHDTHIGIDDPLPPIEPIRGAWRWASLDTTGDAHWERLRSAVDAWFDSRPAQFGSVYRRSDGTFGVAIARSDGTTILNIHFSADTATEPVLRDGQIVQETRAFLMSAGARYRMTYGGAIPDATARRAAYRAWYGSRVETLVRDSLPPGTADPDTVVESRVAAAAQAWAAANPDLRSVVVLHAGGDTLPIFLDVVAPPDLDAELVAVADWDPDAIDDAGTGEGGGSGGGHDRGSGGDATRPGAAAGSGDTPGAPGGPLGESERGHRLWPVTGVAGAPLRCEPFLAEPAATELADDHGLVTWMGRIAAELEIPTCGWLGRFAINAAAVVGGRARGVGLASVRASTTNDVTVRPDGGGNNGFLDVRPGASPEFAYLGRLAEIARDVNDFGRAVASMYLDHANAGLVRVAPDRDPDAAAWALRFLQEQPPTMRAGYMHLYAETCRVLLLQQLRTSRQGIVARRDLRFEQTLTSFTQTLDILGESVVQLSTLRRAIRHSGRVHTTGSVRHVLSEPETVRDPEGGSFELPPPIGSVPAVILAAVGDSRIERRGGALVAVHQGRDWTTADLDAGIGMRRSLVNRVDPLFLQVSDLDSLYTGHQRDAGHARRYLSGLLTEMARANDEMMTETSDPDGGSFFALEASQYLKREGGRDWRGLRFELQGIHALADAQLSPHCGRDPAYADGVNAAISRKADFDTFVLLFSTVGIIALGLLCAPLGAVVVGVVTGLAGLAATAWDLREADRQSDLYRALEDPELFLRWQEVQLAQLMAGLSVAFSVFDVIGVGRAAHAIVGTARHGMRVAERAGARMAVASVARTARREIVQSMTHEVLENAARQAAAQGAIIAAMNTLLPAVIAPVLVPWLRAQAREHGTLAEVDAALGELAVGLPPPAPITAAGSSAAPSSAEASSAEASSAAASSTSTAAPGPAVIP